MVTITGRPVTVQPNGGEALGILPYPNAIYRIVLRGNQTGNLFLINEGLVYSGEGAQSHTHLKEDETIYVVNGSLQFYVDGHQFCAPAGTTVYIPRNATQSIRNINSKPAHVQILFTPSGREFYLEQISVVYNTEPINQTRVDELGVEYGFIFLPQVEWKDLNCVSNANAPSAFSSSLKFLFAQFYFITYIYRK